ncbi:lipopolysaccharide biosynthesis protein [Calidithermus chliarophilus]|uniref:lipopolysaccharide biosynthesis protein n=1 Tax=Calidithermus chliarophilus TaxID=52023 RepID=UPI00056BBC66|nr:lipopolysaccharide biosynthesis protein [Calidithermus chliarophilus]
MLLIKHSSIYILARGIPGLINFMAIALYTRLLSPEEYGQYVLILGGVGLFNVVFFHWLRLSLLRFFPAAHEDSKPLLSTIFASFLSIVCLTGVLGLLVALFWPSSVWRSLILVAVLLLWAQAWFDLNLEFARIRFQLVRYGLMTGGSAISALAFGTAAVLWGLGAYGPILGLLVGLLSAGLWRAGTDWKEVPIRISKPLMGALLRYGFPLTATFALTFVVSASDRFIIARFLGEGPAGIYAASYDLIQQSLAYFMMVVNLAAYPLAVQALERQGFEAAQEQLRRNGILLMGVSFPAAVGLIILGPNIISILLGSGFRDQATFLLPWITIAILLAGIRAYYFDLAFQLSRYTSGQIWVVGAAALLNLILNLWWIPIFGLLGAAYATLFAYLLALLLSSALGRRVFVLPIPYQDIGKIILASLITGLVLLPTLRYRGVEGLVIQVLVGSATYIVLTTLLNVGGYRSRLLCMFRFWRSKND